MGTDKCICLGKLGNALWRTEHMNCPLQKKEEFLKSIEEKKKVLPGRRQAYAKACQQHGELKELQDTCYDVNVSPGSMQTMVNFW